MLKKILKHILLIAFCGFLFSFLIGQPALAVLDSYVGVNSEVKNRQNETPPIFGTSHKGIDSAFQTEIFRLTGPVGSNALIEDNAQYRNKIPWMHFSDPWSKSGDHFIFQSYGTNGYKISIMTLDRQNFAVTKLKDIPNTPNDSPIAYENRSAWFDPNNELLLYGVTNYGGEFYAYNAGETAVNLGNKIIQPNSFLELFNIRNKIPGASYMVQTFMWNDAKTFSFEVYDSNYKVMGFGSYTWDIDPTNGSVHFIDIRSWPVYDEDWTDRKNYMVAAGASDGNPNHIPSGQYGIIRFDRDGNYIDSYWDRDNPYMSTGKASGYNGWWVNRNGYAISRTYLRNSTDVNTFYSIWPPTSQSGSGVRDDPLDLGWSWAHNPSYSNSEWVYAADYSDIGSGPTTKVGQDEVYAIDVRNPSAPSHWKRIVRMWNFYSSSEPSAYTNQPDCYGSPNNDYVIYWSNMRAAGESVGRWDAFIARIQSSIPDTTPPAAPTGVAVN